MQIPARPEAACGGSGRMGRFTSPTTSPATSVSVTFTDVTASAEELVYVDEGLRQHFLLTQDLFFC